MDIEQSQSAVSRQLLAGSLFTLCSKYENCSRLLSSAFDIRRVQKERMPCTGQGWRQVNGAQTGDNTFCDRFGWALNKESILLQHQLDFAVVPGAGMNKLPDLWWEGHLHSGKRHCSVLQYYNRNIVSCGVW